MKILVIGGTGFIGLPLVKRLLRDEHDVITVSRGKKSSELPKEVCHVQLCRKDDARFERYFGGARFDAIYDFAAYTARNVIEIGNTFTGAVRYILVSSASVYGPKDYREKISEDCPYIPTPWHDYAYNKWLAEQELAGFPQLSWIIVRPCVVYGPGDPHEPRVSHFFRRVLHQVPIIVPGKNDICNNYLYVDDLAELMALCLHAPERTVINAGGAEAFTWPHYLEIVAEVMERPLPPCRFLGMDLEEFRRWEYCKSLQFHHNAFYNFVVDIRRARDLGWEPKFSLRRGLSATWQWLNTEQNRELRDAEAELRAEEKWTGSLLR